MTRQKFQIASSIPQVTWTRHGRGGALSCARWCRCRSFDGGKGLEPQFETVWRQADISTAFRRCFINKMDKLGADFYYPSTPSRPSLGRPRSPAPIGAENDFPGVVDLIRMKAYVWNDVSGDGRSLRHHRHPGRPAGQGSRYRAELRRQSPVLELTRTRSCRSTASEESMAALTSRCCGSEPVPSIVGFDPKDESIEIDRTPTTDDPFDVRSSRLRQGLPVYWRRVVTPC